MVISWQTQKIGGNVKISISRDGGKVFEKEPVVRTKKENGKVVEYIVPETEYTNVRWEAKQKLKPKKTQLFKYRVQVN